MTRASLRLLSRWPDAVLLHGLLLPALLSSSVAFADTSAAATQFQTQCIACHTIGGGKQVGPDLLGVTERRTRDWLQRWITQPDVLLAEKDAIAMELLATYQVPMPNQQVTAEQADALIDYLATRSTELAQTGAPDAGTMPVDASPPPAPQPMGEIQQTALWIFLGFAAFIAVVFAWVSASAGSASSGTASGAYTLRTVIFWLSVPILVGLLFFTLRKTPYSTEGTPDRVVYVATRQFEFIFSNEPITKSEDLSSVKRITLDALPAGGLLEFRVTSLDVTHNFAIYDEQGAVHAQVQSMPGYVNRLRTRLEKPGTYNVLCLEYCGLAHHVMKASLTTR